ncbi:undecaprenyldiphospho-muramoylpentapeptide beta-N-acetylglucosaminyltransferase [Gilliamella sp. Choc4-2]|jgi:UDP-N-acetylglucosamine--N-acetylmuramyl-(pentapeptide) pyrophosphoryl-undecaprenol N-acetylglucosamine transferase|uniref:undecaprenyldiphospho-muramoylpentapeptide beta-N-acetylglucosaminyltransferase n=1 Tax=unclassified Gilliamella TaxID=2685620 RepID=UPI00054D387A|nr:undecaprenyldiphospho-muramoylpentapeptide beta-N-acetylglucosaminyltransferase [Gilliamella apicola]OCG30361.1 undecaprenyldiphospho-muramoylpentapeptide beta-N-acetylglucosaminyltransferase [Gilliamella apicola]OCG47301.1 undecaprenyldiphospho-muramoylpentapeptide beta-N-acetylglucosaminyltransferase [Gilliamella apicola]OCG55415.1 undecaprenyldiphospho-muramoylpentapeptide beta-N-acetylglucosaminyltransferase [Gilliamella apicola]OCG63083.1 undecaprenyldiphospho-muramoylpentapeptide beta-
MRKLLIMAGGTGGHVFPGIAVAHYLMKQGWEVRWLGTADRMEAHLVPENGIEIDFIEISGLRGKGIKSLFKAPYKILKAVLQARRILKTYAPDVVLGMGGYVSGPGGIAAKTLGIPIVLHEQNGVAGLTNKWLAKIATKVLQAFPTAFPNAEVVGNPVRSDLLTMAPPEIRFKDSERPIRILVMGGSQGARIINDVVPQVITELSDKYVVWHQTGKSMFESVIQAYQHCDMTNNKVTEFITDVAEAYNWADIVICRSGALTVSEIETVGIGAIFVPFMHKDRQQYWNAKPLADIGAAEIIEQPDFNVKSLSNILLKLSYEKLSEMAIKAKSLSIVNSTERVAETLKSVIK